MATSREQIAARGSAGELDDLKLPEVPYVPLPAICNRQNLETWNRDMYSRWRDWRNQVNSILTRTGRF